LRRLGGGPGEIKTPYSLEGPGGMCRRGFFCLLFHTSSTLPRRKIAFVACRRGRGAWCLFHVALAEDRFLVMPEAGSGAGASSTLPWQEIVFLSCLRRAPFHRRKGAKVRRGCGPGPHFGPRRCHAGELANPRPTALR